MMRRTNSAGFTAVELLITLFVAAAFLVAGYQLFNLIIKDGGNTRVESSASTIAYDHLRNYSNSAENPCRGKTAYTNPSLTVEGAAKADITVLITCEQSDAPSLSKVEVTLNYTTGTDNNTVKYAAYVDKSKGATTSTDVTTGLMEWWKLNGDTNSSAGSTTLINDGAETTAGADTGNPNPVGAYTFVAANQRTLRAPNFSSRLVGLPTFSITGWVNPTSSPAAHAGFFGIRNDSLGGVYALQVAGTNTLECRMIMSGGAYAQTSTLTLTPNTWQLISIVYDGNLRCYVNNTASTAVAANWASVTTTTLPFTIGNVSNHYLTGSIDDVRIYGRNISASDILQLVTGKAK